MQMISVSPDASAELAIATATAAATILTRAITRIVLCTLAASATHKALEDLTGSHADMEALRAHRLAVLQAILATLSVHSHAEASTAHARLGLPAQHARALRSQCRELRKSAQKTPETDKPNAEY